MREIKFRAWHKEMKKFIGFWMYGLYMYENGQIYSGDMNVTDRIELLQYTGLKDKNGKEIYEGDMLSVINPNGEVDALCIVEYNEKSGCYEYQPDAGYGDFDISSIGWAMDMEFEFTLIGNIYENPELLK